MWILWYILLIPFLFAGAGVAIYSECLMTMGVENQISAEKQNSESI
jgi:hypothetical protein